MVKALPEDVREHIADSSKYIAYTNGILPDAIEAFAYKSAGRD